MDYVDGFLVRKQISIMMGFWEQVQFSVNKYAVVSARTGCFKIDLGSIYLVVLRSDGTPLLPQCFMKDVLVAKLYRSCKLNLVEIE